MVISRDPRFSSRYLIFLVLFCLVVRKSYSLVRSPMINLPRNRDKVFALGHDPSERHLPGSDVTFFSDRGNLLNEFVVRFKVLGLKEGGLNERTKLATKSGYLQSGCSYRFPHISFLEIIGARVNTSQHSSSKRTVGNDCDSEFATGFQDTDLGRLDFETEGGIFNLHRVDRMHCVGSAEGVGTAGGQGEILDFSFPNLAVSSCIYMGWQLIMAGEGLLLDELRHCSDRFLNRDIRIHPNSIS